jgi:hypothetical protein
MSKEVFCPGCGERLSLNGLKVGDRIDCSHCANLTLRLKEKDGGHFLVEVSKVSCPSCNQILEVAEGLGPGDTLTCCGRDFVLSYEFGAYALESGRKPRQSIRKRRSL